VRRNTVAVIVTFNRRKQFQTTLEHTLAQDFYRVVVVDNHSDDGTAEWLDAQEDSRLNVIHSGENLGGAGGFHLGFKYATEQIPDAEWLVCFDDDAFPQPGMLEAFQELDIPSDVGSLAAAVYLPDGRVSEMNRPSVNPLWHVKELFKTALTGRRGFHVSDEDYRLESPRDVDASSFVGFFLRLALIREKKIGLPRRELFIYADDIIYILEMRKTGVRHLFVPRLKFTHDCETLIEQRDVYRPLWRVYYTFRNRMEMYRVASGIFYPFIFLVKIPKFFMSVIYYEPFERKRFLTVAARAFWDGIRRNYSKSSQEVFKLSEI